MKSPHKNLIALLVSTLVVAGCIDPQRIREMSDEMVQNIARKNAVSYLTLRDASRNELLMRAPCCDDLTRVRPSVRFRSNEMVATVGVGSMLDNRVVEIDGHRSFYGMFDLDGPLSGNQRIDVGLMATPGYADPETFTIAATILFPDFLYLNAQREEIGRESLAPGSNGHRIGGTITPPARTQFIVVYSSKESVATKTARLWFSGTTSAMPVGGAIVAIRTPPRESTFLPAYKGSVTLTLAP